MQYRDICQQCGAIRCKDDDGGINGPCYHCHGTGTEMQFRHGDGLAWHYKCSACWNAVDAPNLLCSSCVREDEERAQERAIYGGAEL